MNPSESASKIHQRVVFGIGLVFVTITIILGNYAQHYGYISWWTAVPTFPTILLGLISSFEFDGRSSPTWLFVIIVLLTIVSCIALFVGVIVDGLVYSSVSSYLGCYRFNGDSRIQQREPNNFGGSGYGYACCELNPQPTDQCFYPALNGSNICLCCTGAQTGYNHMVDGDCSMIQSFYTPCILACIFFQLACFILLIVGCSLRCCRSNRQVAQVTPVASPAFEKMTLE
eukprot:c14360_g1_i1.p1 GENE.c14360_g1_i1~~c14360_g1_i1.p1  ORF type:complete len:250 (-),score=42.30 c14360_g1_i1:39-725(-)